MLGAAFTTAATLQATSESALTRSTSTWSMTAMSPGRSRLVRFFVRRSRRAVPATPGAVSVARPRRRVPMRMVAMVPWGPGSPVPTRTSDGPITPSERHHNCREISRVAAGVAVRGPDRPVTSVTGVTAGASASRSTATVLADDLVEEAAGRRNAGGPTAPGTADDAQVVPLAPRPPVADPPAPDGDAVEPPAEPTPGT